MSRLLSFSYRVELAFDQPVRGHAFSLRCLPPSFPGQDVVDVALSLDPAVPWALQRDCFGNTLIIGRVEAPHDHFSYCVRGTARLDLAQRAPEPPLPVFRYPSACTRPDTELRRLAGSLTLPERPRDKVWTLAEAVHSALRYVPGVTGTGTTAAEALALGQGVCQDFAHVYLALGRLYGLPVRYASGLPVGEGETHAWCEVWLDGVWTGIDPTRLCWTDEGYLRVCVGRDFRDCPMERGVFLGLANQRQAVRAWVTQQ